MGLLTVLFEWMGPGEGDGQTIPVFHEERDYGTPGPVRVYISGKEFTGPETIEDAVAPTTYTVEKLRAGIQLVQDYAPPTQMTPLQPNYPDDYYERDAYLFTSGEDNDG